MNVQVTETGKRKRDPRMLNGLFIRFKWGRLIAALFVSGSLLFANVVKAQDKSSLAGGAFSFVTEKHFTAKKPISQTWG